MKVTVFYGNELVETNLKRITEEEQQLILGGENENCLSRKSKQWKNNHV